jgi:hypothetical protein
MEGVPLPFRATYPCRSGRCCEPKMGDQRAASRMALDRDYPSVFEFVEPVSFSFLGQARSFKGFGCQFYRIAPISFEDEPVEFNQHRPSRAAEMV